MKYFYNTLGAFLCLLALVFVVVPGPSIIFLLGALLCFSIHNPGARKYLKRCQIMLKSTCEALDKRLGR